MSHTKARLLLGSAVLLTVLPPMASAEGVGGYAGAGLGIPTVAYGSSGLALKIFGGYKVHDFAIPKAGTIQLAVQGEYIDFGKSTWVSSWTNTGISVAAVGSWVIPKKWAPWADEKVAVLAKLGGASVTTKSSFGTSYTYTGLAEGIGAEYRFIPSVSVRAMVENYPNAYQVYGVSGVFHF